MSAVDLQEIRNLLEKRKEERVSQGDSDILWASLPREKDKEFRVRFLPPCPKDAGGVPGKIIKKHYNLPEVGSLTCMKTHGKECKICNVIEEFRHKSANIEEYEPWSKAYHNVLIYGNSDHEEGVVHLLGSSEYNFWWVLEQLVNPDVGDITDIKDGSTVTFSRKSDGGALTRVVGRKSFPIADSKEEMDKILDSMYSLDEIWSEPDEEYLKKISTAAEALRILLMDKSDALTEESKPQEPSKGLDKNEEEPDEKLISRPKGAPECFGTHAETSAADETKCIICPKEIDCKAASK